jgi:putative nucleotidyltransferase with HDIG domain
MVIIKCDKEWLKLPFFGKPLENNDPIKVLKNYGVNHVVIMCDDVEINEENKEEINNEATPDTAAVQKYSSTIEEVNHLQRLYKTNLEMVKDIIEDARKGRELYFEDISIVIDQLLEECFKKPTFVASVTRIKNSEDYEISHALNVAILNMVLARKIGMDIDEMRLMGIGGLLHDIGKVKIPPEILAKPDKLTDNEFKFVKLHPYFGLKMLRGRFPKVVLDCVAFHHEKADGSGYPFRLKDAQIPKHAKITSVSDVYDAMTSDKAYRDGSTAYKAISEMLKSAGLQFNSVIIKLFIEIMGGYPPGTLVLLDSGELAIVFKENPNDPTYPIVIVVSDRNQKPVSPYLFDLNDYNLLTKKPYKTIITALDRKKYNIDTNSIIDEFLNTTSVEAKYG